ncbi:MAG: potassium channel family protein [Pseudomonadota bacterium]
MSKWIHGPKHYWTILIALLFLIFLTAFMEEHSVLYILFAFSLLWVFGSVIFTIRKTRTSAIIAIISGVIALISGFLWAVPGVSELLTIHAFIVCALSYAVFIFVAILCIVRSVFYGQRVTMDRIVGSVCGYLLVGLCFAFVFAALDIINPSSFDFGGNATHTIENFRDFIYFSYSTLATIGYGDMLPTSPLTRILSSLEGIVGSIYLVVMVARLVGMQVSQSARNALDQIEEK